MLRLVAMVMAVRRSMSVVDCLRLRSWNGFCVKREGQRCIWVPTAAASSARCESAAEQPDKSLQRITRLEGALCPLQSNIIPEFCRPCQIQRRAGKYAKRQHPLFEHVKSLLVGRSLSFYGVLHTSMRLQRMHKGFREPRST